MTPARRFALVTGLAACALCALPAACSNDASTATGTHADEGAQPNLPAADGGELVDASGSNPKADAATTTTTTTTTTGGDAAACSAVYASDFDRTCKVDTDCAAVPFGGNLCDPCGTSAQCFQCPIASVNVAVADTYIATLRAAVYAAEAQSPTLDCFLASCPILSVDAGDAPRCIGGTCTGFSGGCQ